MLIFDKNSWTTNIFFLIHPCAQIRGALHDIKTEIFTFSHFRNYTCVWLESSCKQWTVAQFSNKRLFNRIIWDLLSRPQIFVNSTSACGIMGQNARCWPSFAPVLVQCMLFVCLISVLVLNPQSRLQDVTLICIQSIEAVAKSVILMSKTVWHSSPGATEWRPQKHKNESSSYKIETTCYWN